jgi:hypothetical protein
VSTVLRFVQYYFSKTESGRAILKTMREILEASQKEKKGLVLYVKGQTITGAVVKIEGDTVELRSREYSRIVVRMDAIDGAAII